MRRRIVRFRDDTNRVRTSSQIRMGIAGGRACTLIGAFIIIFAIFLCDSRTWTIPRVKEDRYLKIQFSRQDAFGIIVVVFFFFQDYSTASSTSTHEPIMAASPMAIRSMNDGPHHIYECRRTNIIGSLVQNASPFLFPCTIEYSLICAAILYVMWKNISRVHAAVYRHPKAERCEDLITPYNKKPHYYSVDCAQAHKGLFVGILFLVLTIISLILFFVLISKKELVEFAVTEVNIGELSLYGLTTMATIVGMIQVGTKSLWQRI